jgi:hypothetical protein
MIQQKLTWVVALKIVEMSAGSEGVTEEEMDTEMKQVENKLKVFALALNDLMNNGSQFKIEEK